MASLAIQTGKDSCRCHPSLASIFNNAWNRSTCFRHLASMEERAIPESFLPENSIFRKTLLGDHHANYSE
jgi:hypothetical protein